MDIQTTGVEFFYENGYGSGITRVNVRFISNNIDGSSLNGNQFITLEEYNNTTDVASLEALVQGKLATALA